MESIFNDLMNGGAYILEATTQCEVEALLWPIITAMFDTNTTVCIHGFEADFLKCQLLPNDIQINLRREYYQKLGDYETLSKLEKQDIDRKWPLLVQNPTPCSLTIVTECSILTPKSIQVVYTPREMPRWIYVKIQPNPPAKKMELIMVVIPLDMENALLQIQKCAPFTDVGYLLKYGDTKVVKDASLMLCCTNALEKRSIEQEIYRTNNLRTQFQRKSYPRWDWCIDFLSKTNEKVIILTATCLPAGLSPCNHILTIPGVFHHCIHIDGLELGPRMTLHAQRAMNDFHTAGRVLIITNAHEHSESLAGNFPLWLRTTSYTNLILLDAAYQRWPLPKSVTNVVNIQRVVLSPYRCQRPGVLWVTEKDTQDRSESKFDEFEINRV
jgi:hypothetical protein